jgi:hypothetical protein
MSITHKDIEATVLTILAVLVYATTHEGWNVWLIGDSRRWAAGAILLLGIGACGRGERTTGRVTTLLAILGIAAFLLAVIALWTAALTPLSLLVLDIVMLWAMSTLRHGLGTAGRPVATS